MMEYQIYDNWETVFKDECKEIKKLEKKIKTRNPKFARDNYIDKAGVYQVCTKLNEVLLYRQWNWVNNLGRALKYIGKSESLKPNDKVHFLLDENEEEGKRIAASLRLASKIGMLNKKYGEYLD